MTDEQRLRLRRCVEILRRHHDYDAAVAEIQAVRPGTKKALQHAFARAGLATPAAYLAEPPAPAPLPAWAVPPARKGTVGAVPLGNKGPNGEHPDDDDPALQAEWARIAASTPRGPSVAKADRSHVAPAAPSSLVLGSAGDVVLFIPDTHVPYHDLAAWRLALAVCRVLRPSIVCILGDFADCYAVSSHEKSAGRSSRMADEIDATAECLRELEEASPDARRVYVEGNHENRLNRYIANQASALSGMRGLSFREAVDLDAHGWDWVPYYEHCTIGGTMVTHDGGRAGVYAVRQTMLSMGRSLIIGHVHRIASQQESTLEGRPLAGHSFGWLGSAAGVDYRHRALAAREWQHGVGVGVVDSTGTLHAHAVPFVAGRAVVLGQEVRA